jgi:hypothetical protein
VEHEIFVRPEPDAKSPLNWAKYEVVPAQSLNECPALDIVREWGTNSEAVATTSPDSRLSLN